MMDFSQRYDQAIARRRRIRRAGFMLWGTVIVVGTIVFGRGLGAI